jgi:hypothetical protein
LKIKEKYKDKKYKKMFVKTIDKYSKKIYYMSKKKQTSVLKIFVFKEEQ